MPYFLYARHIIAMQTAASIHVALLGHYRSQIALGILASCSLIALHSRVQYKVGSLHDPCNSIVDAYACS